MDYAVRELRPLFVNGGLTPGRRQPSELFWAMSLKVISGRDKIGVIYSLSEEDDEILHYMANKERGAFDLYRKIIADRVDREAPLSHHMKIFHWALLHDKITAPKGRKKKAENFELNLKILLIAYHLVENFSIPKIGNAAGPNVSVCDAISTAFGRLGYRKSSRAIQELLVHKSSAELRGQARLLMTMETYHPIDQPDDFMRLLEEEGEYSGEAATEMLELLRNANK
ncbi:hypothetical protein [Maritimibacter alkaliphilus]|uniref:hypothetical protein n=1 Tax=Maritimibacter alkaliphilus TaxID=404236 RepID=UPI001C97CDFD|nr:hypothetical protein [Maritimibacter alkaliphilus]MBY6088954.1 hypothetical protein [Maritimibacter alkaliphilus]